MVKKIVMGLGNAVDYELSCITNKIQGLVTRYNICEDDVAAPVNCINSERTLVLSILSMMRTGSGGEFSVDNVDILRNFVDGYFQGTHNVTLGGTPVRAALAMANFQHSHNVVLHLTTVNDHVRNGLPKECCRYICSNRQGDTLSPHLIVQFERGDTITMYDGVHISVPQSNRIIYLNDKDNTTMEIDERLEKEMSDADIVLLSGFNAMQRQELLLSRLDLLASILPKDQQQATVVYEDGGFYNPDFCGLIFEHSIMDCIDIYSMNEDEMQSHLKKQTLDLLDANQVKDALATLSAMIRANNLVVHTARYALCYGQDAKKYKHALEGGVTMGTTRYLHGDQFTPIQYKTIQEQPPNEQGRVFCSKLEALLGSGLVCCVPVARIAQPDTATTVGLGDSFVGGFLLALVGEENGD